MRIKVNSLNLGLFYETCLICTKDTLDFFMETKAVLEKDFACKTYIYVYDRDPMDEQTRRIIKRCYSNIFMLTQGVCEAAVADENHPFRQVYAFTQAKNPHSISLISLAAQKRLAFPKDMESFNWLHQKEFGIDVYSGANATENAALLAEKISREVRLNFSYRERKRFYNFPKIDLWDLSYNYGWFVLLSGIALISPLIAFLAPYLADIVPKESDGVLGILGFILPILSVVLQIAAYLSAFFGPAVLVITRLYLLSKYNDVSTTFAAFRQLTAKRLAIILSVISVIGILQYEVFIEGYFADVMNNTSLLCNFLVALCPVIFINLFFFVDSLLMYIFVQKAEHYLDFARRQKLFMLVFWPVMLAVGIVATLIVYSSFLVFPA